MALYANLSTLPDLPVVEIFTMLDFASLHVCRQVCKHWNQMILSNVWGRKTNRGIMEQKFRRYWDTGTREINSSSRSLGFKPQYIAVSGDTIVVTENLGVKESTFLKILCSKEPDEWSLPIDGNILKCTLSKNLIVLLIRDKNFSKRIEVYDTYTRHQLVSRRLGANPRIFVDAPKILLRHFQSTSHIASDKIELMDIQDTNKCFRYPLNEINCSKIISFSFPHLILHSRRRKKMYVKMIDQTCKTIKDIRHFDFDCFIEDNYIKSCVFKDEHIFLLLSSSFDENNVRYLKVFTKDGDIVNKIHFAFNIKSWSHSHCGYFIINYRKRPQVSLKEKLTKSNYQLSKNNEHAILHQTRNLLNKNPDQTVRVESAESYREANDTFVKPEELNKVDNVWVLSNHSMKRIKLEQASVEIEERSIIY